MSRSKRNDKEQRYLSKCMERLKKNQRAPPQTTDRLPERYDFYARTDEVIVPSAWIARLDEVNAVDNQFQYLREKIEHDFPKETEKVDREASYCSSAIHKIRKNEFHQRLAEHQMRWHPIMLIGELASSLPKPTTDPSEIERQLYMNR